MGFYFRNLNNILNRFDWQAWDGTTLADSAREAKANVRKALEAGAFIRGDYKYAAHFIMLFLGVRITDGAVYKFPDLAKISNARFIQRFVMKYYTFL